MRIPGFFGLKNYKTSERKVIVGVDIYILQGYYVNEFI